GRGNAFTGSLLGLTSLDPASSGLASSGLAFSDLTFHWVL
ncbi:12646_t:CDS:2, partial [Cetraspora pellucida]